MPMDGLSVSFVVQELREALEGGRVDKVTQPERDELNLLGAQPRPESPFADLGQRGLRAHAPHR